MRELIGLGTGAAGPMASGDPPPVTRDRRRTAAARAATALAGVFVVAVGTVAGLWFVPFVVGLVAGVAARHHRLRVVLPAASAVAVVGWAVPLAWQAGQGEPVGGVARTVGALAGLPASDALVVGLTLLVAALQAVTGTWLARAASPRAAGLRIRARSADLMDPAERVR
jgi:hypothetical protein